LYLAENRDNEENSEKFIYLNKLLNSLANENYSSIKNKEDSEILKKVENIFKDYNFNNKINIDIIKNYCNLLVPLKTLLKSTNF
jgi:hypothetical protein